MRTSVELDELLKALTEARSAIELALIENSKIQHTGVDYDHYAYLIVPKRQRRVWNMLERLAESNFWLRVSRDTGVVDIEPVTTHGGVYAKNGEAAAARAAAEALQAAGVDAGVSEHWR